MINRNLPLNFHINDFSKNCDIVKSKNLEGEVLDLKKNAITNSRVCTQKKESNNNALKVRGLAIN